MSSHRRRVKHFHRTSGPRKALLRGLVGALVENGRIKTTVDKAKEVRRHVERAITIGKKGNLAARRVLLTRIPSANVVRLIMSELSPRFESRPGGYTRIIKLGRRPGDNAEMAFLEFVDYDFESVAAKRKADEAAKAAAEQGANEASGVEKVLRKKAGATKKKAKNSEDDVDSEDLVMKKKTAAKKDTRASSKRT